MDWRQILFLAWPVMLLAASAAQAQGKPGTVRKDVSLISKGKTITAVELQNTHTRSYSMETGVQRQICTLNEKTEGVIWTVVGEGKDIPADAIVLEDGVGRPFPHVCWSRASTGIYGDNTFLLVAGPDEPGHGNRGETAPRQLFLPVRDN